MMKKKKENGGAPFAAKRPKMNHGFPSKRITRIHRKQLKLNQKTYQHKLALIRMIEKDDNDEGKREFFVKVGKHKKFKYFDISNIAFFRNKK